MSMYDPNMMGGYYGGGYADYAAPVDYGMGYYPQYPVYEHNAM